MWNSDDYQVKVILIRHGQVQGNVEKRYIGTTDQSLTEEGKAAILAKKYPGAKMLFTSPMKRCTETGKLIYPRLKVNAINEFREMNFGRFEGKNYDDLKDNEEYQRWIDSGGRRPFPGGDGVELYSLRVARGFSTMLHMAIDRMRSWENGKHQITIAAVVHGGTIMAIQSYLGICGFYDKMYDNGEFHEINLEVKYDIPHDCITMRLPG